MTDVLIEGEEVSETCVREGEGDEARSNKGELETGFAWKPRAIAEAKKKCIVTVATGVIVNGTS